MWTVPQASLGPRPSRFREWVAQTGIDIDREAAAWDTASRDVKIPKAKFQSAFTARQSSAGSASGTKRSNSRSALGSIRAVYLGDGASDAASEMAFSTVAETASGESEDARVQQELARLRTGDDAVQFFARFSGNSSVKVLYCNADLQVDEDGITTRNLVIVPEHKVKPEHYIISASGVFHHVPGEMSESTPLSEWMHHGMLYSVLKSMPYFKLYVYRKNFVQWHTNAKYESFCERRRQLSRSCFLARPAFAKSLAKVQRLVSNAREQPLLHLSHDCQRLGDFADTQHAVCSSASSGARASFERMHDAIAETLIALVVSVQRASAEAVKEQPLSRRQSKSKSIYQEKQEAREQARKRQVAENDLASISKFIRLADYMFQGARVACVLDAAQAFCGRLDSGQRMFTVEARFGEESIDLSPSLDEFSSELRRLWVAVVQAASSTTPLVSHPSLKSGAAINANDCMSVQHILDRSGAFKAHVGHIEEVILRQLEAAEANANEQYMRYYHVHQFGEEWNEDAFVNQPLRHTLESLSKEMGRMVDFKTELEGFRQHRACGIILVHAAGLRSRLERVPDQVLPVIKRLLASNALEKAKTTNEQLCVAMKALDEKPATCKAAETYKGVIEAVEAQLEEGAVGEIEAAWRLLVKHGSRISLDGSMLLDSLRSKQEELLETILPQAKSDLGAIWPSVVVTVHASPRGERDWSLTCSGIGGDELAKLRMDLHDEAVSGFKDVLAGKIGVPSKRLQLVQEDGQVLTDGCMSTEGDVQVRPESMDALLRRRTSGPTSEPRADVDVQDNPPT